LMRPLPPGLFAARFFAAVIRPPLLFLAMGIDLLVVGVRVREPESHHTHYLGPSRQCKV
jgi:hypothetical protein